MVLRSSPVELVKNLDVTHAPPTQTSKYMHRLRFLVFTTMTMFAVEGCEENVESDLPLPTITQRSAEKKEIYPLFAEIQNDASLINTMVRFSTESGDVSMGIYMKNGSLFFIIEGEEIEIPTSMYLVREINKGSESLYDADGFLCSYGLRCLSLTKTDDGMKSVIPGIDTSVITKETLDTLLSKISAEDFSVLPDGNFLIQIDAPNQTTYTFIVTPKTTP